jgi:putative addiction module component (TIGR02574 family)
MTQHTEQLLHQALQLSQVEREELAEQLFLSLDPSASTQADVVSAWGEEVLQRLDQVNTEKVTPITSHELHKEIRAILNGE